MKHLFLKSLLTATSFFFFACSDDSSSSNNVDREEAELSSAAEEISSSSTDDVSSSANLPKGLREATLDDFEKNMEFEGLFNANVYLSVGAKKGLFTLWNPDTAWVVVRSDFENGVLKIDENVAAIASINAKGTVDSLRTLLQGAQITFAFDESSAELKYSLNGKDFSAMKSVAVEVSKNSITKGEELFGTQLVCESISDTLETFTFFEGRYFVEKSINGVSTEWSAGYADIQRGYLLMTPVFFNAPVAAIRTATLSKAFEMSFTSGARSLKCSSKEHLYESIAKKDMAQKWISDVNALDWTLDLQENNTFKITGISSNREPKEAKEGVWDIYGNLLILKNEKCMDTSCKVGIVGEVLDFTPEGFTYEHSDESMPELPKNWELPLYE